MHSAPRDAEVSVTISRHGSVLSLSVPYRVGEAPLGAWQYLWFTGYGSWEWLLALAWLEQIP